MVKGRRWKRRSRNEREVERDRDESQLEVGWNLLDSITSIVVNYCISSGKHVRAMNNPVYPTFI